MFIRLFFRLSVHFRPHSSAIFHPNTPHNFLLPVISIMINDDLSKKSPHFREKYLVLRLVSRSIFLKFSGKTPGAIFLPQFSVRVVIFS